MEKNDNILRPKQLKEYIGQSDIKEQIEISIEGAKIRNENIRHTVFYGGAGLGKTSLARVIANEMNRNIKTILGSLVKEKHEIISLFLKLEKGDILFIDEIHSLKREFQEILYPAMEDFKIDLQDGDDNLSLDIEPFTLIGATTNLGYLTKPLRERFQHCYELTPYSNEDIKHIIKASAERIGSVIEDDAALSIAKRSRGTPRLANNFLLKVNDFVLVNAKRNSTSNNIVEPIITRSITEKAFTMYKVDEFGMNDEERRVLNVMYEHYKKRPVGIKSISLSTNIDQKDLENIIEPFLVQNNFIIRSARGRELTDKGINYIESKQRM